MKPDRGMPPARRWTPKIYGDILIVLTLICAVGFVVILSRQNARLRSSLSGAEVAIADLDAKLLRSVLVSGLESEPLPEVLADRIQMTSPRNTNQQPHAQLLVVYTPDVCVTCLRAGLTSLKSWRHDSVSIQVVTGERSARDRERALLLREDKMMSYPIIFVPVDKLAESLFGYLDGEHAEEPLYLLVTADFVVQAAFQADQQRPELLNEWLKVIQ